MLVGRAESETNKHGYMTISVKRENRDFFDFFTATYEIFLSVLLVKKLNGCVIFLLVTHSECLSEKVLRQNV